MKLKQAWMIRSCGLPLQKGGDVHPKPKHEPKPRLNEITLEGELAMRGAFGSEKAFASKIVVIFHAPGPLATRTAEILLEVLTTEQIGHRPLEVFLLPHKGLKKNAHDHDITHMVDEAKRRGLGASYIFFVGGQETLRLVATELVRKVSVFHALRPEGRELYPPILSHGQFYRLVRDNRSKSFF